MNSSITHKSMKITDILESLRDISIGSRYQDLVDTVVRYGIKISYERVDSIYKRVILTPSKHYISTYSNENPWSCCIVDLENLKVICASTNIFKTKISNAEKSHSLSDYDIYEVHDGTIITLYYYNGYWSIATTKGIDVSNNYWLGDMNYTNIFMELLNKYPLFNDYARFSVEDNKLVSEGLDKEYCYTFIMKHNNFHPYSKQENGLVFIQSTDLRTLESKQEESFYDLEVQKKITNIKTVLEKGLKQKLNGMNVGHLVSYSSRSLDDYLKNTLFGFKLVSKDSRREDLLIESYLLKRIREIVYNPIPKEYMNQINSKDRINFIIMRSYLHETNRTDSLKLFPEWKEKFTVYSKFIDQLLINIAKVYRKDPESELPIYKFAQLIVAKYLIPFRGISVYKSGRDTDNTIKNLIIDPQHTFTLLSGYNIINSMSLSSE